MDVADVRKRKEALQNLIANQVVAFEQETGLRIEGVRMGSYATLDRSPRGVVIVELDVVLP